MALLKPPTLIRSHQLYSSCSHRFLYAFVENSRETLHYVYLQIREIIQRVKHSEDIHAILLCLLAKPEHHIVRIAGVSDSVGASEEHLERNVGNGFAQLCQTFPRALIQEAKSHVKCCT